MICLSYEKHIKNFEPCITHIIQHTPKHNRRDTININLKITSVNKLSKYVEHSNKHIPLLKH